MLPDRLHAVWTPPAGEADFALRWQQFKRAFSAGRSAQPGRSSSQLRKRESGIWQRRYWEHLVRDEEDLVRHVAYVHSIP